MYDPNTRRLPLSPSARDYLIRAAERAERDDRQAVATRLMAYVRVRDAYTRRIGGKA